MEKNLRLPFPDPVSPSRIRAGLLAFAALAGVTRVFIAGYSFGAGDHSWQVPLVKGLASGKMLSDYIFAPPPRLSLFFPAIAFFTRFLRIEHVYLAVYVAASVAASVAVYLLAEKMLESRPAAMLAVILLLVGKDVAAGATTWDGLLIPRVAAQPLLLLSWWMLLNKRTVPSGILAGLAFALHPLTGLYGTAISVATMASSRHLRKDLWKLGCGAVVPVAATLIYVLPSEAPFLTAPDEWVRAMTVRNLHHLTYSSLLALCGLVLYGIVVGALLATRGCRMRLLISAGVLTGLVSLAIALTGVAAHFAGYPNAAAVLLRIPVIAVLQPLRISGLLGILALIATAAVLWRMMQGGLVGRLSAVGSLTAFSFGHYLVGALFLAGALFSSRKTGALRASGVVLSLVALSAPLFSHKPLFVLEAGLLSAAVLATIATRGRMRAAAATLAASVLLLGIIPPRWAGLGAVRAFGPSARRNDTVVRAFEPEPTGDAAMMEAAGWIKANAPEDAVTIVPPSWENFRVVSERPVFATYKDGTLSFFNAGLAAEWLGKMEALKVTLREGGGSQLDSGDEVFYGVLTEGEIRRAASTFTAHYFVKVGGAVPGLETAYSGQHVAIHLIDGEPR